MNRTQLIKDILYHTDYTKIVEFIENYAQENNSFGEKLIQEFNPSKEHNIKPETQSEDYKSIIINAFADSQVDTRYDRYYYRGSESGYDVTEFVQALEPLIEKMRYFIKYENYTEAIAIGKSLIETIPDEWEDYFDEDGEVQYIYDDAISIMEDLLSKNVLPQNLIEELFQWYETQIVDNKHFGVGLNYSLSDLERHFLCVENGLERILKTIDERIMKAEDWKKAGLLIDKIKYLKENDRIEDAETIIEQNISIPDIRGLKLEYLIEDKNYTEAIQLLNEGIIEATVSNHAGNEYRWEKELLKIFQLQENKDKIISQAIKLFKLHPNKEYYDLLKNETPKEQWDEQLKTILKVLDGTRNYSFNTLKADILIEHKMYNDLWLMCKKESATSLTRYEKYLRPDHDNEILEIYRKYVEQQAIITDKDAYKRVADYLIKMKHFPTGKEIVNMLVSTYRQIYKRRPNMMKELERV